MASLLRPAGSGTTEGGSGDAGGGGSRLPTDRPDLAIRGGRRRRIHVVQLRQFEQQLTTLNDEVDQVEVRDMIRALWLLRGRIEISLST